MLPKQYPKWKLVYYCFLKWSFYEEIDLLLSSLCEVVRLKREQNKDLGIGILDSQSTKWVNNKVPNAIDAYKKVRGINVMLVVIDKNGFLIKVMIIVDNIHDLKTTTLLLQVPKNLCSLVQIIIVAGGCRGQPARNIRKTFDFVLQVIIRKESFLGLSNSVHKVIIC